MSIVSSRCRLLAEREAIGQTLERTAESSEAHLPTPRRTAKPREAIVRLILRAVPFVEALLQLLLRTVKLWVTTSRSSGVLEKSWRCTSRPFSARPTPWSRPPASSACGQLFGGDLPLLQRTVNLLEARLQKVYRHLQRPKTHLQWLEAHLQRLEVKLQPLEVTVFSPHYQGFDRKVLSHGRQKRWGGWSSIRREGPGDARRLSVSTQSPSDPERRRLQEQAALPTTLLRAQPSPPNEAFILGL